MNNKGFTLIELVISIAILMIISVPLTNIFLFSTKVNAYGREELDGISAAKKYIEEIKASDELFNVDNEDGIEYKGYKLYVDILGVEEYSSNEIETGLDFSEDIEVVVLGQYNIKHSMDGINYTFLSTPDVEMEFTDKKDFYINGIEVIKNHKDNLNIGLYFDNITGIYDFTVRNFTNYAMNLYVVEPDLKRYKYSLDILNGRVNTYKNLKLNQSVDISPYLLYKIKIDVEKDDKYITTLNGTKRFDY
ncbi:MAG: prepilin-type N-terminal cleavage/methylation domain-containing protein [Bacillota bacterium]|nr:prepilin-type N-terminal cleavage/methylation domain-containing protein [Bacillota bacterium]